MWTNDFKLGTSTFDTGRISSCFQGSVPPQTVAPMSTAPGSTDSKRLRIRTMFRYTLVNGRWNMVRFSPQSTSKPHRAQCNPINLASSWAMYSSQLWSRQDRGGSSWSLPRPKDDRAASEALNGQRPRHGKGSSRNQLERLVRCLCLWNAQEEVKCEVTETPLLHHAKEPSYTPLLCCQASPVFSCFTLPIVLVHMPCASHPCHSGLSILQRINSLKLLHRV